MSATRSPGGRTGFFRLVAIVARRDYVRTVRRRGFVLGTLLLPLSIGALFLVSSIVSSGQFGGDPDPATTAILVVNESTLDLAPAAAIAPRLEQVDRATAEERLRAGSASEYYAIAPGYPEDPRVEQVSAGGGISIDSAQRQSVQLQLLEAVLRAALLADAGLSPVTEARIIAPILLEARTVEGAAVSELSAVASFMVPFLFAFLFVMSIFITSGYLLQSVTEEKENRVVEIVLSSIPSLPLMAGKILGLGAAGLTQVVVWVLTALLAIPLLSERLGGLVDVRLDPLIVLLAFAYFVLGYLAYGGIFAAIGALAPGNREAQQYSGFFGFVAVVPLILAGAFAGDLGAPVVWALALFPLTAPATMLQVLALADPIPWGMVAASLVSLVVFVALATVASARVFRATLLLYGVRPGVRQLVDAVLAR